MTVTLVAAGDSASTLNEIDPGGRTANIFNLPLPRAEIVTLLSELLADPEKRLVEAGPVLVERMRDGLRIHVSRANFIIPYGDLFPLVLE